ncbi:hypothetical protein [Paraburkholderia sp. GAS32]|uniref:hypothetical protein n=1 Tax=Paraburkholderia sp. GAS32 TaxID=3035129 RepID=UPI003D203089
MTGIELAKAIRAATGKVSIPMLAVNEVPYINAEKSDLIAWARRIGDGETFMTLERDGDAWMIVKAQD